MLYVLDQLDRASTAAASGKPIGRDVFSDMEEFFRERVIRLNWTTPDQRRRLAHIRELVAQQTVTILYGAKDREHNHAVVIAERLSRA